MRKPKSSSYRRTKDITGQRFGRLVAIRPVHKNRSGHTFWECHCDCGNTKTVRGSYLITGVTQSCGCLNPIKNRRYDNRGSRHPCWQGGRNLDKNGYVRVPMHGHPDADCNGRVLEHRLVMEKLIGRPLRTEEEVHHIDGNPGNNAPENLKLFPTKAAHSHYHRELEKRR